MCRKRFWKRVLLVLVCMTHIESAPAPALADTAEERFRNEAPAAWDEYDRHMEAYQGKLTFDVSSNVANLKEQTQYEYKANQRCWLIIQQSVLETDRSGFVYAMNPRYAFILRRTSPTSPWVAQSVSDTTKGENDSTIEEALRKLDIIKRGARRLTQFHYGAQNFQEILKKPSFRVVEAKPVHRDGEELVEVVFTNAHPATSDSFNPVQGGTMLLDPRHHWVLRSAQCKLKYSDAEGQYKVHVEPADLAATFLLPRRVVLTEDGVFSATQGRLQKQATITFDLNVPSRLPRDDEFTLTAFGLPEPGGFPRQPTPWYFWAGLVGIVCISLAVLVRWLGRRAERRAA